jgi:hypothetical protein
LKISIYRQCGKAGTFETITEEAGPWGRYDWTITGPASVNCVLKIEPLNDPSKAAYHGPFSIIQGIPQIQVSPSSLNFGYILPGSYKDLILVVENIGTGTLVGKVSASPPFRILEDFSGQPNDNYSIMGHGGLAYKWIRYQPTSPGTHTGTLVFTGGGGATVPVTGENGCSGGVVMLQNVTFTAGNTYNCIATTSITADAGVTVESGATVNFSAPIINLQPGFRVENGAAFSAKQ